MKGPRGGASVTMETRRDFVTTAVSGTGVIKIQKSPRRDGIIACDGCPAGVHSAGGQLGSAFCPRIYHASFLPREKQCK
ncbi:hypothetical protein GDO81_007767 [Engystomops pustulosus]|uniref:Uncharacterized protein n=1 Tax=Engystomops pustulosus TaxID=76066 RepID=A0AAV7C9X2_ENGPU|nr:hypothetical protein GDO81_007767 [Engystomops pustulosus]